MAANRSTLPALKKKEREKAPTIIITVGQNLKFDEGCRDDWKVLLGSSRNKKKKKLRVYA